MRNVGKYVMLCYVTISIFHYTCVFPTLMPFLIAEVGLTSCAVCTIQLCCVYSTVVLCVQYRKGPQETASTILTTRVN